VLSNNNGAIIRSVTLKMILPICSNNWVPNDLNIAVPHNHLSSMSIFFWKIGYILTDTGVDDHLATSDVLLSPTYTLDGCTVTISESAYTGSFLSVILASLHTSNMNFIMPNNICCLYPTIMPSNTTCLFNGSWGLTNSERSSMTSHGFTLFTSSLDLEGACRDLCPRFLRQFHGLKWIGLFRWHGSGLSTLGCISYSWFTGIDCSKSACIVHAQADILHMGACLL